MYKKFTLAFQQYIKLNT